VWTGTVVLAHDGERDVVAAYDPTRDAWQKRGHTPWKPLGHDPYADPASAWTGHEWVLWGGDRSDTLRHCPPEADCFALPDQCQPVGVAFDSRAQRWRVLPMTDVPLRDDATAVWTGEQVLLYGGRDLLHQRRGALGAAPPWNGVAYRPPN
jgi:hypothetical protein